jgi:pimeloyl-ACP methyl ester carboxylesterase
MDAFRAGRLEVRRNLHLGVGFLAATSAITGPGRLAFRRAKTAVGNISLLEAGVGPPVVMLHGLGATKASFLPTVAALAEHHRAIAIDLPGFGDSTKPMGAPYDAPYFARATVALLDALGIDRAHVIGNSMGGRAAIEVGLGHADRVERLVMLAPSMAWLRDRPWAPYLRWLRPELGLLQPVPRGIAEGLVRRLVPEARSGWTAAGFDEFLRTFLTPRGRAAFYAAARHIYLEEPHGERGFWTRLRELSPGSLFVWGRKDTLVPLAFARHVERELPAAEHLELNCGHVPQLERPREVHRAILRFLGEGGARRRVA